MAKGRKCPTKNCGYSMFAFREDEREKGTWVYYRCPNCGMEVKDFEDKPFNPFEKREQDEKRR